MNEIYDADPLDDSFNIDHGHRVDVGAPDGDSGDGNDNDPPYCNAMKTPFLSYFGFD